jgi:hypothetical protein
MFKRVPRPENPEICGQRRSLQRAGFVGIVIPVEAHMNIVEIHTAKGFPALFPPSLSRSRQNIPQVLRYLLR